MIKLNKFLADESGATAIEYGLLAALISVAAVAAFTQVGTSLTTLFEGISGDLGGGGGGGDDAGGDDAGGDDAGGDDS